MLEAIKYLSERIEDVTDKANNEKTNVRDILDSQAMIDAIIVKKHSDDIVLIKKIKEENYAAIKILDTKIDKINEELETTRNDIRDKTKKHKDKMKLKHSFTSIKCNMCDESFQNITDLEKHIKKNHEIHQLFDRDQCKKGFVLKWRLKKHMIMHYIYSYQ